MQENVKPSKINKKRKQSIGINKFLLKKLLMFYIILDECFNLKRKYIKFSDVKQTFWYVKASII